MEEKKKIRVNMRVQTPSGTGVVVYVRNGPPTYADPITASVVLDAKRGKPGYTGTIFDVDKIEPE